MPPPQQQEATGIVFAGRLSVRPSVLSCPSVNAYFTWGDISLSGGCFSTCHKIFITWVDAAEKQRSEVRGQGYSETKCTFMAEAHVWRRGSRGGEVWSGECPRAVVWSCPVQSMLTMSRDCASHCAAAAVADKPASRQSSCIRTHQPRYVTSLASAVSMCCMRRHVVDLCTE